MTDVLSSKNVLLTAADLLSVRVGENNSSLVNLEEVLPWIKTKLEKEDMLPYTGRDIFVREEVARRLRVAYEQLQAEIPGATFLVVYGYRHPKIQSSYFSRRFAAHKAEQENLSEVELIELTHTQVAFPEVAGHPTGGAVDITILDSDGERIDMGTKIADYSEPEKCYTYSSAITKQQAGNRSVLAEVMIASGFAPFNGEWWHFSYGDREWACYYGHETSLYDQIEFSSLE